MSQVGCIAGGLFFGWQGYVSRMNRSLFWFPLSLVFLAVAAQPVPADQYAYNSRSTCVQALEHLHEGAIVIAWCSLCDDERVEIWRVQMAFVAFTGDVAFYEVIIFAKKLYQSKPFESGGHKEPVEYERLPDGEESLAVTGVDLAYIYIAKSDGKFRVLAKELNLKPLECRVKKIRLPKALADELKQPQLDQPPPGWRPVPPGGEKIRRFL
jgi:hypothetical protein